MFPLLFSDPTHVEVRLRKNKDRCQCSVEQRELEDQLCDFRGSKNQCSFYHKILKNLILVIFFVQCNGRSILILSQSQFHVVNEIKYM